MTLPRLLSMLPSSAIPTDLMLTRRAYHIPLVDLMAIMAAPAVPVLVHNGVLGVRVGVSIELGRK